MLIDSHCHIPHKKYGQSVEALVNETKDANVTHMIAIGTSLKENELTLKTTTPPFIPPFQGSNQAKPKPRAMP